jgi:antitoxin (DNA-binding transcriptional repressor) of toxin-antitoxin stability system
VKNVSVVEAKSCFFTLLAQVEAGEEIAIIRDGKVVAWLVPDRCVAADAFRDFWSDSDIDLQAPKDRPAEGVDSLND